MSFSKWHKSTLPSVVEASFVDKINISFSSRGDPIHDITTQKIPPWKKSTLLLRNTKTLRLILILGSTCFHSTLTCFILLTDSSYVELKYEHRLSEVPNRDPKFCTSQLCVMNCMEVELECEEIVASSYTCLFCVIRS